MYQYKITKEESIFLHQTQWVINQIDSLGAKKKSYTMTFTSERSSPSFFSYYYHFFKSYTLQYPIKLNRNSKTNLEKFHEMEGRLHSRLETDIDFLL